MRLIYLLTFVFIMLKLTGNINFTWIEVFSPIWVSALILGGCIVVLDFINGLLNK